VVGWAEPCDEHVLERGYRREGEHAACGDLRRDAIPVRRFHA
jgi:hypothetical protein